MRRKGFTLIELLAVIVVLAVIALIATPIVFGVINTAKKGAAEQSTVAYVKAIESTVTIDDFYNKSYANRDDYLYDEIKADVSGSTPTGGVYALKDGIVTRGTFCVNGYKVTYSDSKAKAYEKCTGDDLKWDGSLKLEQSSGFYVYPESKQINIVENTSGGKISCTSSDEKVATCSVTGTTIKIASGTKEGVSTITVKSEGNSKYKDAYAAYVATTQKGLISYTSNGYKGVYDGNLHGITVIANGFKVKYGETEGIYNLDESPKYVDAGEYKVYYQISKDGYAEVKGSKDVIISQAKGNIVLEETKGNLEYNKIKKVQIKENKANNSLIVSVDDENIAQARIENNELIITGKKVGTTKITLSSSETKNYSSASTEYIVTIIKASNKIVLSSTNGTYTYPNSGTFNIASNPSGGKLSCTTSNKNVAECTISGNTVTVKPGTTKGSATLTITSEATTNYDAGKAVYVAITEPGALSGYTANGYEGVYDGNPHGITVTSSGATIEYGTVKGTYNKTTSPQYTNVGEYTVYYRITRKGYVTVENSENIKITKANNVLKLSSNSGTYTYPNSGTFNITSNPSGGKLSCTTSNKNVAECTISGNTVTVKPGTTKGSATLTITSEATTNYDAGKAVYVAITEPGALVGYTANGYEGVYDGNPHGITVTSSGATITYSLGIMLDSNNIAKIDDTVIDNGIYTFNNITSGNELNTFIIQLHKNETTPDKIQDITLTNATGKIENEYIHEYNSGYYALKIKANGTTKDSAVWYKNIYLEKGKKYNISYEVVKKTSSQHVVKNIEIRSEYSLVASPTRTDAGTTIVYYKISKSGYSTVQGSKKIVITKADGKVTPPTSKTLKYTGNAQELVNAGSSTTGQIQYKVGTTGTYSTKIPTGTDVGTYTVYYKVVGDSNHNDVAERSLNVTIKPTGPTKVKPTSTDTHKGIVYLDPTNLKNSCNVLNSKSGTGIKTGCMKWYIYSEDNNNYTMILDHNIEERMSYSTGMSNLTNQKLNWDNSLKIRMIQANEIAKITGNTSWSTSKGWFYLDSNNQTPVANSTNKSKYAWLFDYIYNCEYGGCNIEDPESGSAYFTGTEANSSVQYIIANGGSLRVGPKSGQGFGGGIGIRPVITISKSIIS